MHHDILNLIGTRFSANRFDPTQAVSNQDIETLIGFATRAPTAFNLQNWRFIAVRSAEAKARLRAVAHDQPKVTEAAVTFVILGVRPDPESLPARLAPSVEAGLMSPRMVQGWREGAALLYADPAMGRDEAVRSATFGAATLMYAAAALGFASGAMAGFDPEGVRREFGLGGDELPVLLLAVGRAASGNWPQKSRRPLGEVLEIV